MLLRESLGISADGSEKLYRDDDVTAFETREPEIIFWEDRDHRKNVQHVFIAVDPSGGGASAFSICSALIKANGTIQVRLRHSRPSPASVPGARRPKACRE